MDIYNNAPPILKHATNKIIFNSRKGEEYTFGVTDLYHMEGAKTITINLLSLQQDKHLRGNLQQILYHEMGHCLSISLMNKEFANLLKKYTVPIGNGAYDFVKGTPKEIRDEIDKRLESGDYVRISSTREFKDIVSKNTQYQEANNLPVEKSSGYGEESYEEDWAEICSMASFHGTDKETLKHAVLENYDYQTVKYDEWVKNNRVTYVWAVEKLATINRKDFNY